MTPCRIQRKRIKGWKMPKNTVYVGRGSKWGNPFEVGEMVSLTLALDTGIHPDCTVRDNQTAVRLFRNLLMKNLAIHDECADHLILLRGKNLACWCRLDQPCHADVLLELANIEVTP